ncbi:MAG: hypothetical protein R2707_09060 [Acidimicrobiales bacterium]
MELTFVGTAEAMDLEVAHRCQALPTPDDKIAVVVLKVEMIEGAPSGVGIFRRRHRLRFASAQPRIVDVHRVGDALGQAGPVVQIERELKPADECLHP